MEAVHSGSDTAKTLLLTIVFGPPMIGLFLLLLIMIVGRAVLIAMGLLEGRR